MRRREFITLLGGAAAWPFRAAAQRSERTLRIGVLMGYAESDPVAQSLLTAFKDGLQELGWTAGRAAWRDQDDPDRIHDRVRSHWRRSGREPLSAGRQYHRIHQH